MMKTELITTADGSHSLYRPDLDEQYHSVFGAIQESSYIYIRCGFSFIQKSGIQVFEMGFGTGLNALLTWLESDQKKKKVKYYSVEKYPLDSETVSLLNYPSFLDPLSGEVFRRIHMADWNRSQMLDHFTLHKIHGDILDIEIPKGNDLVYFDAFSPDKEPELWSERVFHRIYDSMLPGGIFITYSAKGEVKRKLQKIGFKVEKLPGPPRKLHILQAVK